MIRKIFGASIAVALFGACMPALASEASSDGFPPAQNLNYYHVPGADQAIDGAAAPLGVGGAYLFLAGSAFTPRTSSQTVAYSGSGCTYSNGAMTTSLELPENAQIYGVRLYYYSLSPTATVGMFLTTYPGDGSYTDQLSGSSTMSTGYSSEYFLLDAPLTFETLSRSHVLTATMSLDTRFCGMRVYYSP